MKKKTIFVVLTAVAAFVVGFILRDMICVIPPRAQDACKLIFLRREIVEYRDRHGVLPETLGEVLAEVDCERFNVKKKTVGSSGKPIEYLRNGDTNFILRIRGNWHRDGMTDELSTCWMISDTCAPGSECTTETEATK